MERRTNKTTDAGPALLPLIDGRGGDLGAALLRLAHRAAAVHRYEAAMAAAQHELVKATPHGTADASAGGQTR